ncbi:MAG: SpoIIE family protein phosphatase [Planctomycetota bacterium]|nr:SpoIIE family protein phosphatase [Planctomycetota bacterium]
MTAAAQWNVLTGDAEKDRRNVEVLLESVAELYGPRSLEELMARAVDRAIVVAGAERAFLLLADDDGELQTCVARTAAGADLPLTTRYSHTVVNKAWSSGEASLTMDTADPQRGSLSDSILAMRLLSVMAAPLPVQGRSLGVLYVDSTAKVREFTPSDFSVFQALGGLIALAVEQARLIAEKAEQERIKRELLVAQQIQQRLLPASLPQPAGYDLAGTNWPCDETSGDYYDAIPYGEGRLALVVGDVSGHGLGPALIMASTRAMLHSALATRPDPVAVMQAVNSYLERDIPENAFMSMFLGGFDPAAGTLEYVSAGHNPPLLYSPGAPVAELTRTGPVLGVLADARYSRSKTWVLTSGQVLMMYTDGIFEAQAPSREMYGEERLEASFARHAAAGLPAAGILESVLGDLTAFVDGEALADDVTCLVLRVK